VVAADRERLRANFTQVAELYDRARPAYPAPLVADLAQLAGIGPGNRVLEIGPGTGQLTVPLARLGCRVTAVELGPELAAVARRNLAGYPGTDVVVSAFETWPLPDELFDAVVSATAFHWIDPKTRVAKAAAALRPATSLRPGGVLAIVETRHVAGGTASFFAEAQACYERWDPETPPGLRLHRAADINADGADLAESGRFGPVTLRRHEQDVTYPCGAYLDTLRTYSGTLAMDPTARDGLLGCLARLIDSRYGGVVTKRYLFSLRTARVV
jgi:SAM-dependent methyltransferase